MSFVEKDISKTEFETLTSGQKEVFFQGHGTSWDVKIFYNKDNKHYYLTGPFGRWDGTCYWDLGAKELEEVKKIAENYIKGQESIPYRINF